MALERTLRVDPSWAEAEEATIQDAIDRIGDDPTVRWTVLVYAATYGEAVTLPSTRGNIDIVGVDRDAVIIAPVSPDPQTPRDGITISGSGSRKNSIRNLTIKTNNGHGIVVEKSDTENPGDIEISDVTVEAAGDDRNGIVLSDADGVQVTDCKVKATAGHGMVLGDNCTLSQVTVEAAGTDKIGIDLANTSGVQMHDCTAKAAAGHGMVLGDNCGLTSVTVESMGTNRDGVYMSGKSGFVLSGCAIRAKRVGFRFGAGSNNLIRGTEIRGGQQGVWVWAGGTNNVFCDCVLAADENIADEASAYGFHLDSTGGAAIVLQACRLEGTCSGSGVAYGLSSEATCDLRIVDCDIIATCSNESSGSAVGVRAGGSGVDVAIIGGSITTSVAAAKETEVWDLLGWTGDGWPAMSGARCSKWKGPIMSAERPGPTVQRTLNIANADPSAVLADTDLTNAEQEVTAGITDPNVYRVLSAKGNQAGMTQDVYIKGTDWAGNTICEKITLNGAGIVAGVKPFAGVDTIWLPAKTADGQKVRVGTTNKLGLYHPISATGDVMQQARKTPQADSYAIEGTGTVDATYATVDVGLLAGDGYSFEWFILASS